MSYLPNTLVMMESHMSGYELEMDVMLVSWFNPYERKG